MSKRKIKLDLSGGWDEVLEDAININTGTFINAVFADRECVLRRNDRIYDILDLRKGDKISVTYRIGNEGNIQNASGEHSDHSDGK